ncbi:MAG TPA: glycosidase [Syntrophomonadaceae bacterium]|nr:glycosidase [Syntrophomonadaceae bacterium]HPU49522.1 glycosidase [Syntrophomonadaceae bacterium]
MTQSYSESRFDEVMQEIKPLLRDYANFDLVVGIPFVDEQDHLPKLLQSIDEVLKSWIGKRQLIVCVGDGSAQHILASIQSLQLHHPHIEFVLPPEISGRGTSIRALLEIANAIEADLMVFSAHMSSQNDPVLEDAWLDSLLTPIQGDYDLVLGSLRRYQVMDSIAHMLASPILESFYGARVGDPLGGIYAFSHDFVEELVHEGPFWGESIQGYGIDFWILTRALSWNKNICEVNLGGAVKLHNLETRNRIFRENARTIFEAVKRDSAVWLKDRLLIKVADILSRQEVKRPDFITYPPASLLKNFQQSLKRNRDLLAIIDPNGELTSLAYAEPFRMDDDLWVSALFDLMVQYVFSDQVNADAIFDLLTGLYNGRVLSYINEIQDFQKSLPESAEQEQDELILHKMESIHRRLTEVFWKHKPRLNELWSQYQEQCRPPIIPLSYMEYVPGKPIVVPKRIIGKDQRIIATDNIFRELRKRYEDRFNEFISQGLGVDLHSPEEVIIRAMEEYMQKLEAGLDQLLPGDIRTEDGLRSFVEGLLALFPDHRMFTISSDLLREMLVRFPPVNLMIPLGYYKAEQLLENMDPRDVVTYANLMASWSYTDRDLLWLVDNLKPESFEWVDLKPVLLSPELHAGRLSQAKITDLNRVTGRIIVTPMVADQGGKYPKTRYFTSIVRRLAVAEQYSKIFQINVSERKNISLKVRNSLLGIRRGDEFSAHNIFENYHHRSLVKKVKLLAERLEKEGRTEIARLLHLMVQGYGLSQVLEKETFLTCTAWSWASYSFKGGQKIPTPVTTSVESRWFNHDFLEDLYRELGYDPEEMIKIVYRMIQAGKSHVSLLDTLMPTRPKDVTVVVQETTTEPSRPLQRYEGNPLLEPLEGSKWESKYVLNPGALRFGDKVYLFYRAVGEDNISRIGLAITDGFKVLERLPDPIFSPEIPEEKMGCEDPRLIVIEDRIFMLYTAYDGNIAQIAAASISLEDFKAGNYTNWKREGLAFQNIWDKDAIIFPEKINGKYIIYHRIEPSIWVTYSSELKFPIWDKHAIIAGPRPGRMWDSMKIGAGAQPLKTRYGWLLIYHGVDYNYVYRLGVLLVDLDNPRKVIYRSPNPILEPEEDYEIGLSGAWVPNVVFTCGAVPGTDKEILEDDDEILVYYGAADTSIGVAKATLADLVPESFRKVVQK